MRSVAKPNTGGAPYLRRPRAVRRVQPPQGLGTRIFNAGRAQQAQKPAHINNGGAKPPNNRSLAPAVGNTLTSAPPVIHPQAAPRTPRGQSERINAEEQFNRKTTNLNQEIYQAALRYGDPATLAQFRDFGPVVENPNSDLENIRRSEALGLQNVANSANRGNTFFSSLRLGNQQRVADQANRERTDAYARFQEAYGRYTRALTEAKGVKEEVIRNAEAGDIESILNLPPEPTGISGTTAPRTPTRTKSSSSAPRSKSKSKSKSDKSVKKKKNESQPRGLGTRIFRAGQEASKRSVKRRGRR